MPTTMHIIATAKYPQTGRRPVNAATPGPSHSQRSYLPTTYLPLSRRLEILSCLFGVNSRNPGSAAIVTQSSQQVTATMSEQTASSKAEVVANRGFLNRVRAVFYRSEPVRGYTLLSPTFLLMFVALILPLLMLLTFTFWTQNYLDIDKTLTLQNYIKFFDKPIYTKLLWKSIRMSAMVTLFTVLLAYPAAYFIAFRVKKNKMMWLILITVPFWTSYLLRVFAWKVILGYNGVINSGLVGLGIIAEPLQFILYSPTAVVITLAHAWAAFAILPIYVSLEKIDKSLLEAAADLGEGPVMQWVRVTLPLSLPGIIAASLLVFIPTVGDYVTPNLVGGPKGILIGNVIQSLFGKANNWPLGATTAIMSMIFISCLVGTVLWASKRYRAHA